MAYRRVEIIKEEEIFTKFFFRIKEAKLRHQLFNGRMSKELTRIVFTRGDSIAILMHDPEADTIVLTEQFRYPTYKPNSPRDDGWLLEIPAGTVEPGESPEDTVRREVKEEIGYDLREVKHISTFYLSPGGASEQILLYYAKVSPKDQKNRGGGVVSEGEDIKVMLVKVDDAVKKIETGELRDAKSIIALQWLKIQHKSS